MSILDRNCFHFRNVFNFVNHSDSFSYFLVYDASVKIPAGIITGNYKQLGNYDECLQVKSDHGISGQSCSATIQFEVAEDNGASRELDFGDLLVNVAVASVSLSALEPKKYSSPPLPPPSLSLSSFLLSKMLRICSQKLSLWKDLRNFDERVFIASKYK